jgi:hypothetical protein
MPLLHNTPPHAQTHLQLQKAEDRVSSVARVDESHSDTFPARYGPVQQVKGCVDVRIHVFPIIFRQSAAGLRRVATA